MGLQGYRVEPIRYETAKVFIEINHYSKSCNGLKISQCFGLYAPQPQFFGIPKLVGAMIYGSPGMNKQAKKYNPKNPDKVLELRRLACIDDTPKNAESFFISKTLRWLTKNTDIEVVISYADPNFGHEGIIYKASNFKLIGKTAPGMVLMIDGKRYHDRTLRNPKPYAQVIRNRVASGDAKIQTLTTLPKNIYIFQLRR